MDLSILARLFAAKSGHGAPPPLTQEPGNLWAPKTASPMPEHLDLASMKGGDPGAFESRLKSVEDAPMPPTGTMMLDRIEDGPKGPLGVMFYAQGGGPSRSVPMGQLPPGLREGANVYPGDIRTTRRMSSR
jgi:hypothetical protein